MSSAGAAAVTMEDAASQPLYEPPPGATPLWKQTCIVGLFDSDIDLQPVLKALQDTVEEEHYATLRVEQLEEQNWERAWMDQFHPMQFGNRLWICPSWTPPPEPTAINIMLDPGVAFGTGTHPTTALCLRWLDAHPPSQKRAIDFGCGSGILAVAAALLGAKSVVAIDHDPMAVEATLDNAMKNQVADQIQAGNQQIVDTQETVDLLMANILAGPLIELAPLFANITKHNGDIIVSGLILEQSPQLIEHYRKWFNIIATQQEGEWLLIHGVRNDKLAPTLQS